MKKLMWRVGLALAFGALLPVAARAQFIPGNLGAYEQQSHARWMAQRTVFYGPMGPVRGALHQAKAAVDGTVHTLKQMTGNPDLQYYTRWDRKKLGILGPYPGQGYGYGMGGMGAGMGYQAPVVMPAPVYGGAAMNQTGGARYPTRLNPASRLFW